MSVSRPIVDSDVPALSTGWLPYTPTIASVAGAITTATNVGSTYKQIGKTVFVRIAIQVSVNGTGATAINISLPVAATTANSTNTTTGGYGVNYGSGKLLSGVITSATNIRVFNYDATYPLASGDTIAVSVFYEVP